MCFLFRWPDVFALAWIAFLASGLNAICGAEERDRQESADPDISMAQPTAETALAALST